MFSNAMYTIDSAISVSTSGGNHSAAGASPSAEAISVIECATVNAVMIAMSGRSRRNGNHQTKQKQQMIDAVEDVLESQPTNRSAA